MRITRIIQLDCVQPGQLFNDYDGKFNLLYTFEYSDVISFSYPDLIQHFSEYRPLRWDTGM
jgi:hypothetical protein